MTHSDGSAPIDEDAIRSQDTGYVFSSEEAALIAPVIDDGFAGAVEYREAHGKIRPILLSMSGTDTGNEPLDAPGDDDPDRTTSTPGTALVAVIGTPVTHEIDRALSYEFVVPFDGPVVCNLGHDETDSLVVWPPRIECVTATVVDLWEFLAYKSTASAARARFHDLAMVHAPNRYQHGLEAREAYLDFALSVDVIGPDHGYALLRAWAIDRMFGRAEAEQQSRTAMASALSKAWDEGRRTAGILLPMVGALGRTNLNAADDPVPVDELLVRASTLYGGATSVAYIADLRRARATTEEERTAISEWQVREAADEARKSTGMVKAIRMTEAVDLARRLQLRVLQDQLTIELQALPPEDIQFEAVSSTIRVSRIPIEYYLRQFTSDRDWRTGLMRFSKTAPPTGAYDDLLANAEERRLRPRIADLISTVLFDEERLPTWQPETDEERRDWIIAREAAFGAAAHGSQLAEILDRLRNRYGPIPVDDIAALLALEGRGNYELASVFARGLHHYWSGDLEACIHITIPRVESAVRLILRELDVALYRTQLGTRPGIYPALDSLLSSLEDLGFDESWLYFLRWFLANHSGKNMRNQIAHGRVTQVSANDAALALRALMLVTLLAGPGVADNIDDDLTDGPVMTTAPPRDRDQLAPRLANPVGEPVRFPPLSLVLAGRALSLAVEPFRRGLRIVSRPPNRSPDDT